MRFLTSPFVRRFFQYSMVGVGTYALDLCLIFIFKTFLNFPDAIAVGLGFLIAVSINFLISYIWIFKGTDRHHATGYMYFVGIAIFGLGVIVVGTLSIKTLLGIDLYIARTIVAGIVGILNYTLNSVFNFKMIN